MTAVRRSRNRYHGSRRLRGRFSGRMKQRGGSTVAAAVLLFGILGASCVREVPRTRYYILEYKPILKNQKLAVDEPFPCRVLVSDFEIPRSYDSVRIVSRQSSHQINYFHYSLWAVRPQVVIADLVASHLNAYHTFDRSQREFLDERPDYEITGYIHKIERYESGIYRAAHLQVDYYLYNYETNEIVFKHQFDRDVELTTAEFNFFAKKVSDIIREETDLFVGKLIRYFLDIYPPEEEPGGETEGSLPADETFGIEEPGGIEESAGIEEPGSPESMVTGDWGGNE